MTETDQIEFPRISSNAKRHKLIRDCQMAFKAASSDEYGRLCSTRTDVQVSRKSLARALKLLNSIVLSLDKLNYTARYSTKRRAITIERNGHSVGLNIYENSTRLPHVLTSKEERELERSKWYYHKKWDYTPTGKLSLSLTGHRLYNVRSKWNDRINLSLEDSFETIIQGVLAAFNHMEKLKLEDIERDRLQRRQSLVQKRKELVADLTKARAKEIESLVEEWEKSKRITAYLDEMEKSDTDQSPKIKKLHRWARDLASHYDPLQQLEIRYLRESNYK